MMVVVPTSTSVELTYGRSVSDHLTLLATLVGIGLCVLWRRRGDVVHAGELPAGLAGGSSLGSPGTEIDATSDAAGSTDADGDAPGEEPESSDQEIVHPR